MFREFWNKRYLVIFHSSLSDNTSYQTSSALLSIQTDLNSSVVWMASKFPQISNTFTSLSKLFDVVWSDLDTIRITVTLCKVQVFVTLSLSFIFPLSSCVSSRIISIVNFFFRLWTLGLVSDRNYVIRLNLKFR